MKKFLFFLALLPSAVFGAAAYPSQTWVYTDTTGIKIPFAYGTDTNRVPQFTFPPWVTSPEQAEVLALTQFNPNPGGNPPTITIGNIFPPATANSFISADVAESANFAATYPGSYAIMYQVTTGSSTITMTLPAANTCTDGFYLFVRKVDAGAGQIVDSILGASTSTINSVTLYWTNGTSWFELPWAGATGSSGVTGPGSSTNNAIATWNGTGGNALNNTGATVNASGNQITLGGGSTITDNGSGSIAITPNSGGTAAISLLGGSVGVNSTGGPTIAGPAGQTVSITSNAGAGASLTFSPNSTIGTSTATQTVTVNTIYTLSGNIANTNEGLLTVVDSNTTSANIGLAYLLVPGLTANHSAVLQIARSISTSDGVFMEYNSAGTNQLTSSGALGMTSISPTPINWNGFSNTWFGASAPATTAQVGFPFIPVMAGTPTGVLISAPAGYGPIVIDSTNQNLDFNVGSAWFNASQNQIINSMGILSGSNKLAGTVTLTAGLATITSTAITANAVISFSLKTSSGTPALTQPLASVTGGSATVTGAVTDNSTYNWVAIIVH